MPEENTPEEGDESTADPTPEPAAQSSSPWAQDLESIFADEAMRGQVDGFLREKVQPYVTQLEQSSSTDRNAKKLWDDFAENPVDTFIAVSEELFGDETKDAFINVLSGEESGEESDDDYTGHTADDDDSTTVELPEDVQEAVEWFQEEQRTREYRHELDRIKEDFSDVDLDEDLFHPFVVAADGDFETAIEGYKAWAEQAKEKYGINVPSEGDVTPPPTTIGSTTTGNAPPPTEQNYDSIDDALDAFFDEQKSPPVTVGNV